MLERLHNSMLLGVSAARRTAAVGWAESQVRRSFPGVMEVVRKRWRGSQYLYDVNHAGKSLRGRALLSYVPRAFTLDASSPKFLNHSNFWECREIARILGEMGFVVDVCDCLNGNIEMRRKYDVVFDAGYNLERMTEHLDDGCCKIAYATGRHWRVNNAAEEERLSELFERRGTLLQARRNSRSTQVAERCDALLYVGNRVVCESFSHIAAPRFGVPVSVPDSLFDHTPRDWEQARRNVLWLGSGGMVHKGLDLVLDAFSGMPDLKLHVVGPFDQEQDFVESYRRELFDLPNVVAHKFLDVAGDEFRTIAQECGLMIYPSCSEGTPGSVLTAMAKGIIPIVTPECGLDPRPYGLMLEEHRPQTIHAAVLDLASRPACELQSRSAGSRKFVREHHSRECFTSAMRIALESALACGASTHHQAEWRRPKLTMDCQCPAGRGEEA